MRYITTSWDDGHPLDFKIAELLDKYNLKGTFYIPKTNAEHRVMVERDIQELAGKFEVGGHTLSHVRLNTGNADWLRNEIQGCYVWLTELLGKSPASFCFPGGKYNGLAVEQARKAGFSVLRTTELLSTKPLQQGLVPTTIQVYEHGRSTYAKHLMKRKRIKHLITWLRGNSPTRLLKLVDFYLDLVSENGGCLHVWGHSWEIEEFGLWSKLELILKQLSSHDRFMYIANGELSQANEK